MLRKILSIILAVSIIAGLFTVNVFAEDYRTSRIAYFDANGDVVTTITQNAEITAKVKAKSTGSASGFTFMLMLYQDDMILDVAFGTEEEANGVVTYSATLTMPADVTGCELNGVLWDDLKSMNAICSSSIFPSESTELFYLKVDGVDILSEFDSDKVYEYKIPFGSKKMPVVECKAIDNGTKIEIIDPITYPGEAVVNVTASNGTVDTYTIIYSSAIPSQVGDTVDGATPTAASYATIDADGLVISTSTATKETPTINFPVVIESAADFPSGAKYSVLEYTVEFTEPIKNTILRFFGYWDVNSAATVYEPDGEEHKFTFVVDTVNYDAFVFIDGILKAGMNKISNSSNFKYYKQRPYLSMIFYFVEEYVNGPFMKIKDVKQSFYNSTLEFSHIGLYAGAGEYDENSGKYYLSHEISRIRRVSGTLPAIDYIGSEDIKFVGYDENGNELFSADTGYAATTGIGGRLVEFTAESAQKASTGKVIINGSSDPSYEFGIKLKGSGYDAKAENPDADLEF